MYETAFGFHRHPFQAFDPRRPFFMSGCVRKLLPQLLHALRTDLGVAVLTGPSGIGKSAFLRHLRSVLSGETRVLLCSAASMESSGSFWELLSAAPAVPRGATTGAGGSTIPPATLSGSRWSVVERLQKSAELWGPLVLLIDDAHLLTPTVLHELRALLEESGTSGQLVRALIAGPLSLEEEFARPSHADFSGMIRCHGFLQPLTSPESVQYLDSLIANVGRELREILESSALEILVQAADGNPRCLNLLADEAFVVAHESGARTLDVQHVRAALTRLRHLPYAWNAPAGLLDESLNEAEFGTGSDSRHATGSSAVAGTGFRTGTVFSSDGQSGVVEIGTTLSEETAPKSARIESPEAWLPVPASVVEFGSTVVELGSSLEPEQFAELELPTFLEESDSASESADQITLAATELETPPLTDVDWPALHDVPERTQGEGFMVPSSPFMAQEFSSLEGSNRLPVFDRYTWIEFHREVPPGDQSILSSRNRSRQGAEAQASPDRFLALTADQVPIFTVTEENFETWLNGARVSELESGVFRANVVANEQPVGRTAEAEKQTEADKQTEFAKQAGSEEDAGSEGESEERFFFSLPIPVEPMGGTFGSGSTRPIGRTSIDLERDSTSRRDTVAKIPSGRTVSANDMLGVQDEVLPLAKSVANLHDEVHSFHAGLSTGAISGNQGAQPYVVGSLLREALNRAEPEQPAVEAPEVAKSEPVDEGNLPARFTNLFSSLRSLRRIDTN